MMGGHYVLIVVGNKAWYHWSASKGVVAISQGVPSCAPCDVRALLILLSHGLEGWGVCIWCCHASVVVSCFSSRGTSRGLVARGNIDTFLEEKVRERK